MLRRNNTSQRVSERQASKQKTAKETEDQEGQIGAKANLQK